MVADVIYHCRFPSLSLSLKNLRLITLCGRSSNNLNWDSPKDAIVFYSILLEDLVLWSALYQLHLVKSETVRAFIPKEFKLVEAFGYDDSPAGIFDELVVIAGIVWNPPTSCAWAARVLVNSDEACVHGRKGWLKNPVILSRFQFVIWSGDSPCLSCIHFCRMWDFLVKLPGFPSLGQGSTRAKFQQVDWASYQDVTSKLQVVSAFVCIIKPLFVETNLYFIYYIAVDVQSIILIFLNILAKLSAG
ncbi:hypothetical protein RHGRI_032915 [Rhododendron griersonianum]|uniref:Uncharacterized protein n=1 Tax=Rhododendron griersonianum TaxID=479676 RepID=A0AAV6IE95_9ERIC|nr:hypothetical protein RHGRI_032915 [Rhododendron griersonianum]